MYIFLLAFVDSDKWFCNTLLSGYINAYCYWHWHTQWHLWNYMLQDSVLGVELLLRQFQKIFTWWMKWKNLDSLSYVKLWNLDSLLCEKFAQIVCVNEMMKFGSLLFMCEQIWTVWTYRIDWTSFWTDFMCERVEQNFLWSFSEIWTDFMWTSWTGFFY